MKNNKGYTLIEMVIVIAIMAILTGVSVVTIGVIKEAKVNAAINTIENQMSSLWIKTKALSQSKVQSSPLSSGEAGTYPLCMMIEKNTDDSDDVKDGSYQLILGYEAGSGFVDKEVVATLTDYISIVYTDSAGVELTDSIVIQFNKSNGSVVKGAGTYNIIYNDKVFGTIYLDGVTGNHYIK